MVPSSPEVHRRSSRLTTRPTSDPCDPTRRSHAGRSDRLVIGEAGRPGNDRESCEGYAPSISRPPADVCRLYCIVRDSGAVSAREETEWICIHDRAHVFQPGTRARECYPRRLNKGSSQTKIWTNRGLWLCVTPNRLSDHPIWDEDLLEGNALVLIEVAQS